jgi:hypothetical protein
MKKDKEELNNESSCQEKCSTPDGFAEYRVRAAQAREEGKTAQTAKVQS